MSISDFYDNYSRVGDVITIAICFINWFLLTSAYVEKKKNLTIFHLANALCIAAACCSICYHAQLDKHTQTSVYLAYFFGKSMYNLLIMIFVLFLYYLANLVYITGKKRKILNTVLLSAYLVYFVLQVTSYKTHIGFYFDSNLELHQFYIFDIFTAAYIFYALVAIAIIIVKANSFVTKVRRCLERVIAVAFLFMLAQIPIRQMSFTCITFTFPIIAGLFLFHYNAYDIDTGSLDKKSFNAYLKDLGRRDYSIICMHLREAPDKKMRELSEYFFHFNEQFFKETCTFRMGNTTMVLVYPMDKNPRDREVYPELLEQFEALYNRYKMEYKLTFIKSDNRIEDGDAYLELARLMERQMEWDSCKWSDEKDIEAYIRMVTIRSELKDIFERRDYDDQRVKVYCQPVLNCVEGKFTTAEALMRMELPGKGMIYPDEFIPIAERNEYIHVLSLIILNKTCKNVLDIERQGFNIERVSVNFSMTELRDDSFCDDIIGIIKDTGIEPGKIAIELTESRNAKDRELVERVMTTLQGKGIKFYLDDFGTGYSNFEKIIGLPFDIVKFDRSLTIMSGKSEQSKYMVDSFADIFIKSGYQVLFEGIEDENDEARCKGMKAEYLQGYKYSKPVPIEGLIRFLEYRE